jgi:2-polyprenyl-3-methyl-5-hydroxy-6-metoxy-1,4-benzoquinol methylase
MTVKIQSVVPARRDLQPELMDQPTLDRREHFHALASLGIANLVSRSVAALWPAVREVAARIPDRPVRILDLACGGGHVAVGLARRCNRAGVAAEILGTDASPAAVDFARSLAARSGTSRVTFAQLDAMNGLLPDLFDVVLCSLFLHHLSDEHAVSMLARMKDAARHLVLVSDLRRTTLGYLFAWVGCRIISRSRVFHIDSALSVRAAFTTDEARLIARRAGLVDARVTKCWPQRFVLEWRRDG